MTVFVVGNSQTVALVKGFSRLPEAANYLRVFALGRGGHELTDFSAIRENTVVPTVGEYAKRLLHWTGVSHFDKTAVWGLCQGTHSGRIYRKKFWNDADPSEIAVRGRRPVSLGVLDAIIATDQLYIRAFIRRLKETGTKCFVVACPPPHADHRSVHKGTRLETILYIDQRARRLMREWLSEMEIPFIDYPPEVATDEGLLKPEYYGPGLNDDQHANADYGLLMIRRIIDHIPKYLSSLAKQHHEAICESA